MGCLAIPDAFRHVLCRSQVAPDAGFRLSFVRVFARIGSLALSLKTMRKFPKLPKLLLVTLAMFFAAATILYSGLWMYGTATHWQSGLELGFDNEYVASEHCELIRSIVSGSPAERAGLRPGDRILRIDGRQIEDAYSLSDVWERRRPGDTVELTIARASVSAPFVVKAVFRRAGHLGWKEGGITQHLGEDVIDTFPVAFLVVGLAVLFLRLEDPNAWLLALMFAGFIAVPSFPDGFAGLGPSLRPFAMAYRAIFDSSIGALFYFFFAVFPARSPLDRRASWLKWVGLATGASLALANLRVGDPHAPAVLLRLVGEHAADIIRLSFLYGFVALGLVSLTWNAFSTTTAEARRKMRVILWGTLVGVVPVVLQRGADDFFGFHTPFLLGVAFVILVFLFPISFAYAVVKHRVLEIPVLLRRSARYLLVQRGFTILLALVSVGVTLVFALAFAHYLEPLTGAAVPGGIALGTGFGTLLLWTGAQVHKGVGGRIDRAFFHNAYDARVILQDLAEKTRTATDRKELAELLEHHLIKALQPSSFAVYLETRENRLCAVRGDVPPAWQTISATQPFLADLARKGRPWEVSEESLSNLPFLLALRPDCLVPMLGRDSRLVGLLVLGPRLSEEPYSREDKYLLASVASQAGVALESIRLGEQIAERIEAERRTAQEMEFARQVQARLFPQKLPPLATLEYSGTCTQAREVGGDYFDFLDLGPGRVGMVLADIAGKGISGAMLMANLQANLRSQYAVALSDLPGLLRSVNHLLYENTAEASYATLFFADYEDSGRRLRYVNCGHCPPMLLRSNDTIERLTATATALGLFDNWECSVEEVSLTPGDTLVVYSDGVTEAATAEGEEFGECRLAETLRLQRHLPVSTLLEAIVATVQKFSDGEQADDITLVIARCRS